MEFFDADLFWKILIAAGLSVPVGLERELRGKAAGLRTHVVVATASAALGAVSVIAAAGEMTDETRIAAQVVSGIGFMGAGVIFASGGRVHGLTTAAALWSSMAIGLCVGLGSTDLGVALVTVTLLFLWPMNWISERVIGRFALEERSFQVVAQDVTGVNAVQTALAAVGARAMNFEISPFADGVWIRILVRCKRAEAVKILRSLQDVEELRFVTDEALSIPPD